MSNYLYCFSNLNSLDIQGYTNDQLIENVKLSPSITSLKLGPSKENSRLPKLSSSISKLEIGNNFNGTLKRKDFTSSLTSLSITGIKQLDDVELLSLGGLINLIHLKVNLDTIILNFKDEIIRDMVNYFKELKSLIINGEEIKIQDIRFNLKEDYKFQFIKFSQVDDDEEEDTDGYSNEFNRIFNGFTGVPNDGLDYLMEELDGFDDDDD